MFNYKREDYVTEWFNPDVTKTKFTVEKFLIKIIYDFKYKDMKNNLI